MRNCSVCVNIPVSGAVDMSCPAFVGTTKPVDMSCPAVTGKTIPVDMGCPAPCQNCLAEPLPKLKVAEPQIEEYPCDLFSP